MGRARLGSAEGPPPHLVHCIGSLRLAATLCGNVFISWPLHRFNGVCDRCDVGLQLCPFCLDESVTLQLPGTLRLPGMVMCHQCEVAQHGTHLLTASWCTVGNGGGLTMDTTETALLLRVLGACTTVELHVRLCPSRLGAPEAEALIMEGILEAQWALILFLWSQEEEVPGEDLDMEPPADEVLITRYAAQVQLRLSGWGPAMATDPRELALALREALTGGLRDGRQ